MVVRVSLGMAGGREVFLDEDDLKEHAVFVAGTGRGKSNGMELVAFQLAMQGQGVCVTDMHGDMSERLFTRVSENREGLSPFQKMETYYGNIDEHHTFHLDPFVQS